MTVVSDPDSQAMQPSEMYRRVQLMLLQMVVITVVTIAIFFGPEPTGSILFVGLYGMLLYFEQRIGIRNWQTIVLFGLALLSLALLPWSDSIGLYIPAVLYAIMFGFSAFHMVRGRPMTMVYGGGHGHPAIHWRTSVLWLCIFASALAASLLMFQHLWMITTLPIIMAIGVIGTLWLQLQTKIGALRPGRTFEDGGFEFSELEPTKDNIDAFYHHYARETLYRSPNRAGQKARAEISILSQKEQEMGADELYVQRYFVARKDDEIIGSITFLKMPKGWEHTEIGESLDLDEIRAKYGSIGMIDHFCIAPKYRNRPSIMQRLLRMAIEASFEADCSFITTFAFADIATLYRKIGFVPILDRDVASIHCGTLLSPMILNLAQSAVCDFDEMDKRGYGRDDLLGHNNLGERFFKRQVVKSLLKSPPAWQLDIKSRFVGAPAVPGTFASSTAGH